MANVSDHAVPSAFYITPIGMLSFPSLFTPKPRLGTGEMVYAASLIFDEDAQKTNEFAKLKDAAYQTCVAKFGSRMNDPGFVARLRNPFNDAGAKSQYKGYDPGKKVINCWSKFQPGVVGPQRQQMLEGDVYPGQLARFSVTPYAYDQLGNVGVAFSLNNVQICKVVMPRLDSRKSAEDSFDTLPVDGEDVVPTAPSGSPSASRTNPF